MLPEMTDCFFHAVEHALAEIQITFTFRGVAEIGVERTLEIECCGSCGEFALRSKMIASPLTERAARPYLSAISYA